MNTNSKVALATGFLITFGSLTGGTKGGVIFSNDNPYRHFQHQFINDAEISVLEIVAPEIAIGQDWPHKYSVSLELQRAMVSFERKEYEDCLNLLKASVKKYAELPPAKLMLARLFLSNDMFAEGRAALEQAASEEPTYPGTYVTFGQLALDDGRVTDAMLHFEKAMSLSKGDSRTAEQRRNLHLRIYAGLAAVAADRKDWSSAKAYISAWLELDPKNGSARNQLARALFEAGEFERAKEELQRAVDDDPSREPAAIAMGWLHAEKGNLEEARRWMEIAVQREPGNAKAHRALATWLFRQGDVERSKKHVTTAAKLDPTSNETKVLLGLVARYLGDYTEAERIFDEICQESPGDSSARNQLALVLIEQPLESKRERARQLAEINVRLYPSSPEALSTLGWVYFHLGRIDEAERALQSAKSRGFNAPDTNYYLARVMAQRDRQELAKQLVETALGSSGAFLHRKEALEWLGRINGSPQ